MAAKPRAAPSSVALNADRARVDMVTSSSLATEQTPEGGKVAGRHGCSAHCTSAKWEPPGRGRFGRPNPPHCGGLLGNFLAATCAECRSARPTASLTQALRGLFLTVVGREVLPLRGRSHIYDFDGQFCGTLLPFVSFGHFSTILVPKRTIICLPLWIEWCLIQPYCY